MRTSKRRKSNPYNNPLTLEDKALALALRELSKGLEHKFPPGMGGPELDLTGVTLADSLPVIERLMAGTKNPMIRNKMAQSLATLDQRCAALRDRP
jgi:hypothetical protein